MLTRTACLQGILLFVIWFSGYVASFSFRRVYVAVSLIAMVVWNTRGGSRSASETSAYTIFNNGEALPGQVSRAYVCYDAALLELTLVQLTAAHVDAALRGRRATRDAFGAGATHHGDAEAEEQFQQDLQAALAESRTSARQGQRLGGALGELTASGGAGDDASVRRRAVAAAAAERRATAAA